MKQQNLTIVKRDGTTAPFSMDKITNSIQRAFSSRDEEVGMEALSRILSHLHFYDGITVEDIQYQVEVALMEEKFFDSARAFMLYRYQHSEDRLTMEQLKFLTGYCNASNAATGSKYDANANVEHKNIATLIGELPKGQFIRLNRRMLTDRIKKLYGKEMANRYLDLLNNHFIYKNDETSLATTVPQSPCIPGSTMVHTESVETARLPRTSNHSAADSSTWCSSYRQCFQVLVLLLSS